MPELEQQELRAITRLGDALPVWQKQMGPGLDAVFSAVKSLIRELDVAAAAADRAGRGINGERAALVGALESRLAAGPEILPGVAKQKKIRLAELGPDAAELQLAYDVKTLELMAADFPAWYAEAGSGGFFKSLNFIIEVFADNFEEMCDKEDAQMGQILFVPAFELRRNLGKVSEELLEAIKLHGNAA